MTGMKTCIILDIKNPPGSRTSVIVIINIILRHDKTFLKSTAVTAMIRECSLFIPGVGTEEKLI